MSVRWNRVGGKNKSDLQGNDLGRQIQYNLNNMIITLIYSLYSRVSGPECNAKPSHTFSVLNKGIFLPFDVQ